MNENKLFNIIHKMYKLFGERYILHKTFFIL